MQVSAFVDGELPDNEADLLLRRMSQDAALRRQAAEYLDIGRAMRGEASVPGIDRMLERVSADIEDRPIEPLPDIETVEDRESGAVRPLVGVAVAASVALVALFSLQLRPPAEPTEPAETIEVPPTVVVTQEAVLPVQPALDEELHRYYLSHGATSSQFGANGMNARLVSLQISEEVLLEPADEGASDDEADADSAAPLR
jgi:anti-sigma factor RsiW